MAAWSLRAGRPWPGVLLVRVLSGAQLLGPRQPPRAQVAPAVCGHGKHLDLASCPCCQGRGFSRPTSHDVTGCHRKAGSSTIGEIFGTGQIHRIQIAVLIDDSYGAATIIGLENLLADKVGSWVTVIMGGMFVVCVLAFRRGMVGELAAMLNKNGISRPGPGGH